MRRAPLAAFVLAVAMALSACGEKDETDSTTAVATTESTIDATDTTTADPVPPPDSNGGKNLSTEDRIRTTVIEVIGGGDPASACRELVTEQYVRTAYGDEQGCRAAVAGQPTFDVAVQAISVDDPEATVKARPAGGPTKGETLTARLVEERGTWKVDFLRSNAPAGP